MESHVKIVAWIHIAFGALGLLTGLLMGGIGLIAAVASGNADGLMAGGIMGVIAMFVTVLSLPSLVGGWGLLTYRPWARILVIVLSVLNLLNIPFGTLIGGYSLWVLLNEQTQRIFQAGGTRFSY